MKEKKNIKINKNCKKRKGISLIVLVITIIIIIVLATAVILSIANNNPIEKAKEAKFLNDVKVMEEKYELEKMNKYLDGKDIKEITIEDLTDNEEYRKKFEIEDGKIVLKKSEATNEELEWANKNNVQIKKNSLKVSEGGYNNTFLGMGKRGSITKVIFEDTISNAPEDAIDLSEKSNGSILGWLNGTEAHIASDGIILANENSSSLFAYLSGCTSIENLYLLDTSNTTNMYLMFYLCFNLTSLDLSQFDTSKVTNMQGMFYQCTSLTSLDLSSFDTSKVTIMQQTFEGCDKLKIIYISDTFDTNAVTNSQNMFGGCSVLEGGNGTTYDVNYIDKTYARIDKAGTPGYFTLKKD